MGIGFRAYQNADALLAVGLVTLSPSAFTVFYLNEKCNIYFARPRLRVL